MIYATLTTVHVQSIIVRIGGMAFAHFFLRPALARLEAPVRLRLIEDQHASHTSRITSAPTVRSSSCPKCRRRMRPARSIRTSVGVPCMP
jgi:hypothetical protein